MTDYKQSYVHTNDELIQQLGLQKHPEGGYFKETDRQDATVPSPFANNEPRSLATSIYYLLTHEERAGKLHLNKSVTYHVLHQGRAEYTLIRPSATPNGAPTISKHIMGTNVSAGETRMLLVEGSVWKMSRIPESDIAAADAGGIDAKARTGCLITEVVTPGFHWEDHTFLTRKGLEALFEHAPDREVGLKEFEGSVKE